jgi:zinc/manganese transport system substrate-binding protein
MSSFLSALFISAMFSLSSFAFGKILVVTTTTDLAAIVDAVGGKQVNVESICKGTQDPHFIEPKPSYMVKASRADLFVSIGLGLEIGWLPSILRGARNPKIVFGQQGNLEVGPSLEVLEVPTGKVTRAQGDVHPEGNPHVTLDPIRVGEIAVLIGKRLGEIDPPNAVDYQKNAQAFKKNMDDSVKLWQERITKSGIKKIITHHKTLEYFVNRFGIEVPAILEPLPGIPPTARHTLNVIGIAKTQGVKLVLVENFFAASVADRIAKDVPGLKVISVPVSVGGAPTIKNINDLFERLVEAIEGKK